MRGWPVAITEDADGSICGILVSLSDSARIAPRQKMSVGGASAHDMLVISNAQAVYAHEGQVFGWASLPQDLEGQEPDGGVHNGDVSVGTAMMVVEPGGQISRVGGFRLM